MRRIEALLTGILILLIVNIGLTIYFNVRGGERKVVSEQIPTPKLVKKARVEYPEDLRKRGIEGRVYLRVLVDTTGRVGDVQVLRSSGYPEMDSAAIRAAWQYKFEPAMEDGRKVRAWVNIPFLFKLAR
jgi:protein TonB